MVSMKPCSRGVHSMCTPMISSLEHACMHAINLGQAGQAFKAYLDQSVISSF